MHFPTMMKIDMGKASSENEKNTENLTGVRNLTLSNIIPIGMKQRITGLTFSFQMGASR